MKTKESKPLSSPMRRFIFAITQNEAKDKIAEFRSFWGIDPDGFENDDRYNQWAEEIVAHPPVELKRIGFTTKTEEFTITKNGINKGKNKKNTKYTHPKASRLAFFNDNFQKAVDELGREIKMDNNWCNLFSIYLLRGPKKLIPDSEPGISIYKITEYYEEEKPIKQHLDITIDPNTTKDELLSAWERFIGPEKEGLVGVINHLSKMDI